MLLNKSTKIASFVTVAFAIFVLSSANGCSNANAQSRGTKNPAYQILRDSTITKLLLDPEFLDEIVLKASSGNAPLADSAITLRLSQLTSGHFTSSSRDSILKLLVDSTNYARYLRANAISNRSPFTSAFFDSLRTKLIQKADTSTYSNRSVYSDSASFANHSSSTEKYLGSDPVPEATHAATADYAETAGSALAVLAYFTDAQWDSIIDTVNALSAALDTVNVSWLSLAVASGAVDSLSNFTATMRDSYLVTKAQKDGIRLAPTAITSTNPALDTTTATTRFARNVYATPMYIGGLGTSGSAQIGSIPTAIFDSTSGKLYFWDAQNQKKVFLDSTNMIAAAAALDDTDSLDYVLRGTGATPATIYSRSSGSPTGGSDLDVWFSGGDTSIYQKLGGNWVEVGGGGGGGGSPSSLTIDAGVVDADSVVFKHRDATTITGRWQSSQYYGNSDTVSFTGKTIVDSLFGENGTVFLGDTITSVGIGSNRLIIGRPQEATSQRPISYTGVFNVGASGTEDYQFSAGGSSALSSLIPKTDSTYNLGEFDPTTGIPGDGSSKSWLGVSAKRGRFADSLYIGGTSNLQRWTAGNGIELNGRQLYVNNENVVVSNGNVSVTTGSITNGGTTWDNSGLTMGGGDNITLVSGGDVIVPSTSTIQLQSGAELLVPSDGSNSFADLDNPAIQYYLTDSLEKSGLVNACPDPSYLNPFITRTWMKHWVADVFYPAIDSLAAYRLNTNHFRFFKPPGCDDTLFWEPGRNQQIVWPVRPTLPSVDPGGNQALLKPWTRPIGDPIGPFWTDSVSNGLIYSDPGAGNSEQMLYVSERFDSTFSYLTGKYPTLKMALDSVLNIRCKLGGEPGTDGSARDLDTFYVKTRTSGYHGYAIYHGNSLAMNIDSIQGYLPDFVTEPGVWVQFEKSGQSTSRWAMIEGWISDTIFTVRDSLIQKTSMDSTWTLTFAKKQIITILPPVTGGFVPITATANILDCAPVHIKGTDKNDVILTNRTGTGTPSVATLISAAGGTTTNEYVGMPIELSDMTIWVDTATTNGAGVVLAGNVTMSRMNLFYKSSVSSKGCVRYERNTGDVTKWSQPTLTLEDVTVWADNDMACIYVDTDSLIFSSMNSAYSVGGDSGSVVTFANAANCYNQPYFFGDQYYLRTTGARMIECVGAQTDQKVISFGCYFFGRDPNTFSNVVQDAGSGFAGWAGDVVLYYSGDALYPPPKLRNITVPIKVPYGPK